MANVVLVKQVVRVMEDVMYQAVGCRLQMTALGKNTAPLILVPVCTQIQSTRTILSYESTEIAHHVKRAADNSATVAFLCSKCKVCFLNHCIMLKQLLVVKSLIWRR